MSDRKERRTPREPLRRRRPFTRRGLMQLVFLGLFLAAAVELLSHTGFGK